MLWITPTITIDDDELEESFVRASGPGGQNVNMVATAVQLRFHAANSPNLTERVKIKLAQLAGQRMTTDGVLVIKADRFRSQERNRQDARQRLIDLIRAAATTQRRRIATRPTKASKERRLKAKSQRSKVKRGRSRNQPFE